MASASNKSADGSVVRARAAIVVAGVLEGRSLDDLLPAERDRMSDRDGALLAALSYGVLRDLGALRGLLAQLLQRALDKRATTLEALLCVGLFQLRSMRIADHAAVSATVSATSRCGQSARRGLVNAILRRYQREREDLESGLSDDLATRHSHPAWLVGALQRDWREQAESILDANQQSAPMTLRVNRTNTDVENYRERLAAVGIEATEVVGVPDALLLAEPVNVADLPGFSDGDVSVQDASAQLAAVLLDCLDGQRVLDACSAPGGKAIHMMETAQLSLTAIDSDPARLVRIQENADRARVHPHIQQGDALKPDSWWDGKPFDRILVDAPCSATGVIRRHPDIKWLRRESDIARLAQRQREMINALWPLLAPGGVFLFATCSVLAMESDAVIADTLATFSDAVIAPINLNIGEQTEHGVRIAPGGAYDGFYYSRYRRLESGESAT